MRLQLILYIIGAATFSVSYGQNKPDSTATERKPIEVSFLTSYYQQDGVHSPVTGGSGTEQLSNIAPVVYVYVPLDSGKAIGASAGVDFYSSASSDNIDNPYLSGNHISGASANDIRHHYTLSYSHGKHGNKHTYKLGASSEYDVTSLSGGYSFERTSTNQQRGFSAGINYFFDDWKLIYPVELRNGTVQYLSADKRHTLDLQLSQSFIINRRMNMAISIEALGQYGMLSTPFHRVYFEGQDVPSVEMLPSTRLKIPVSLRYNIHVTNWMILRTFNRLYWDSWNVQAYTAEIETPFKVAQWLRISPFYRYHVQKGSRYFAPYGAHLSTEQYFTSDYDLSGFTTNKYGMEVKLAPLFGIGRFKWFKQQTGVFKSIAFRFAWFERSDGLSAWSLTTGLDFKIHRK